MIYIANKLQQQFIHVPARGADLEGCDFILFSTIDRKEMRPLGQFTAVMEGMYAKLTFVLDGLLPVGEYEYTFCNGGTIYARGLAQVGEFAHGHTEYNKNIEYEQY